MDSNLCVISNYGAVSAVDLCKALGNLNVDGTPLEVWKICKIGEFRKHILKTQPFFDSHIHSNAESDSVALYMRMAQSFSHIDAAFDRLQELQTKSENDHNSTIFTFYEKLFTDLLLGKKDYPTLSPSDLLKIKDQTLIGIRLKFVNTLFEMGIPTPEMQQFLKCILNPESTEKK